MGAADRARRGHHGTLGLGRADAPGLGHPRRLPRVFGAPLRDRVLRRQTRDGRPLGHRQSGDLQLVTRRLRDGVDLLWKRRPGGERWGRVPADLYRPDAHVPARLVRAAQDDSHQQGEPHHLARRFHRVALRQERAPRRDRHGDRGDRHPAVHLAPAEGGVLELPDPAAIPADRDAAAGRVGVDPAGHGLLRCARHGALHDRLRHARARRERAPRGHGGGDRLRGAGEARGIPRRGRLRHLRDLQRRGRHLPAGRDAPRALAPHDAVRRRAGRLCGLGLAHRALHAGDPLPAAPVPGRGDRERRREAPAQGHVALPALHGGDQPLRAADRIRRAACLSRTQCRRRHVRADAPHGLPPRGARAARLHRRVIGSDRHGDRRDHRAFDHGVQRPRDAGAAALEVAQSRGPNRCHAVAARHPALGDRGDTAPGLFLFPPRGRSLRVGLDRPHFVRRGGAIRSGGDRRDLLEGRHAAGRARGTGCGFLRVALHAPPACVRQVGLARHRVSRERAIRDRAPQAGAALRPRGTRPDHSRHDLEHGREHRRLCAGLARRAAKPGRA